MMDVICYVMELVVKFCEFRYMYIKILLDVVICWILCCLIIKFFIFVWFSILVYWYFYILLFELLILMLLGDVVMRLVGK